MVSRKKNLIYAIIPARGGSKSIPKKNIVDIGGYPLIAYSIIAAKLSKSVDRIIVSTDSEEIAEVARKYGAEVPFLRPAEFSTDTSVDREFVIHALEWFEENEGKIPDYLVHLRPTSPLRDPKKIKEAVDLIVENPEATSLRSAHELSVPPQKCFQLNGKYFRGLFPEDKRPEYHGLPRQAFLPTYKPDGYVDVLKSEFIVSHENMTHGDKILAFFTPDTGDIDNYSDLSYIKRVIQEQKWEVHEYLKKKFSAQN